jgi:hypothetical protein
VQARSPRPKPLTPRIRRSCECPARSPTRTAQVGLSAEVGNAPQPSACLGCKRHMGGTYLARCWVTLPPPFGGTRLSGAGRFGLAAETPQVAATTTATGDRRARYQPNSDNEAPWRPSLSSRPQLSAYPACPAQGSKPRSWYSATSLTRPLVFERPHCEANSLRLGGTHSPPHNGPQSCRLAPGTDAGWFIATAVTL